MSEPPLNEPSSKVDSPGAVGSDRYEVPGSYPRRGCVGWLLGGWTLLFRLAILTGGMSLAWLGGAIAAQLIPGPAPQQPPLQEVAQRRINRLIYKAEQLPRWWGGGLTSTPAQPSEDTATSSPTGLGSASSPTASNLGEVDREAVKSELSALETELSALDNRIAALETKVGEPVSDSPLEARVQRLSRAMLGATSTPTVTATATTAQSGGSAPRGPTGAEASPDILGNPLFQLAQDRVTLPSALLFAPEQALLTPNAERILDTLLPDLSRYPTATIVVGSHSDGPQGSDFYQDLTFKQALAVQQYLESRLGTDYHWVPVGYGKTEPLVAGSTPVTQQRNQRIELGIVPSR